MRNGLTFASCLFLLSACSEEAGTFPGLDSGVRDSGAFDGALPFDASTDATSTDSATDLTLVDLGVDGLTQVDLGSDAAEPSDLGVDADHDAGSVVTGACAGFNDEALRHIVYEGPRVPAGFYWEEEMMDAFPQWQDPCSDSAFDTHVRAEELFGAESVVADFTETKFYQANVMPLGVTYTVYFRNTRCDYFDGDVLAGAPHTSPDALGDLAQYQWFLNYYNLSGAAIAGASGACDGEACTYDLCSIETVYGDFGLCDEISLVQTHYSISVDGHVTAGAPTTVHTIEGHCS